MQDSRRGFLKLSPTLFFGLSQISNKNPFDTAVKAISADQVREILQSANYNPLDPGLNLANIARGSIKQIKYSGESGRQPYISYQLDFYFNNGRGDYAGQRLYVSDGFENTPIDGRTDFFYREYIKNAESAGTAEYSLRSYSLEQRTKVAQSLLDSLTKFF